MRPNLALERWSALCDYGPYNIAKQFNLIKIKPLVHTNSFLIESHGFIYEVQIYFGDNLKFFLFQSRADS